MTNKTLPLVSVIIPVYNADKTLQTALQALKAQTYPFLEIIIVNDCSTDKSGDIINDFANVISIKSDVSLKICNHEINKGVAAARNTGLDNVRGKYIYYVDADDYIEPKGIEILVNEAEINNADIVGCNWYLQFQKNSRLMIQPKIETNLQAIELMSKGVMRWNLWLFLVNADLYKNNNIRFIEGANMGEDMMVMYKLFLHAQNIKNIDNAIYYYGLSNEQSLTKTYSNKHKYEVEKNLEELNKYFANFIKDVNWNLLVNFLKLNIKLPLLITNRREKYIEWYSWFSESNDYVLANDKVSKRVKLLQYMASKRQFWFLKLHYYIVIKFVYGIIYK